MIIFESHLTTFEASVIYWGSWGSTENGLEPKIKLPKPSLTKLHNTLWQYHERSTKYDCCGTLLLYLVKHVTFLKHYTFEKPYLFTTTEYSLK